MAIARVLAVLLVLACAVTVQAVVVDIRMDFGTVAASPGDN